MNYSRPRAALALPSSVALQMTAQIALFALLAVCGPARQAALGAPHMQTTKLPGREAQEEAQKQPAGEDQARMEAPRRRLYEERAEYNAPAGGSAQIAACQQVLTLADLERMALREIGAERGTLTPPSPAVQGDQMTDMTRRIEA